MNDISNYLSQIELALISSPVIAGYEVVRVWENLDDGYICIRATLTNGDFLSAAEYFVAGEREIEIVDYRHQWMSGDKNAIRRRWDSTPHHPQLDNFPYHEHIGDNVLPSRPVSILALLRWLEEEHSRG